MVAVVSLKAMAQTDIEKLKKNVSNATDKIESQCIAWRRDIHEHP